MPPAADWCHTPISWVPPAPEPAIVRLANPRVGVDSSRCTRSGNPAATGPVPPGDAHTLSTTRPVIVLGGRLPGSRDAVRHPRIFAVPQSRGPRSPEGLASGCSEGDLPRSFCRRRFCGSPAERAGPAPKRPACSGGSAGGRDAHCSEFRSATDLSVPERPHQRPPAATRVPVSDDYTRGERLASVASISRTVSNSHPGIPDSGAGTSSVLVCTTY